MWKHVRELVKVESVKPERLLTTSFCRAVKIFQWSFNFFFYLQMPQKIEKLGRISSLRKQANLIEREREEEVEEEKEKKEEKMEEEERAGRRG